MGEHNLLYYVATTMLQGVGSVLARQLISFLGSAEQIFKEPIQSLKKIPKVGDIIAANMEPEKALLMAEKEIEFCMRNNISVVPIYDANYPQRLKNCNDAPLVFYSRGNINYNREKVISIVGTRNATEYGRRCCSHIVEQLKHHNPIIVSGLALGIDIAAHKESLKHGVTTVAVLGSPLSKLSPASHTQYAREIVEQQGAVISEYHSNTKFDAALYVQRNRIIAGLSDLTIIVESKVKGGALLTAEFANGYDREVATFPGTAFSETSKGCNELIKHSKAHLIDSAADIERLLNWDVKRREARRVQKQLFLELNADEQAIYSLLNTAKELTIDQIALQSNIVMAKTSYTLLQLEFKGLVLSLPGKRFTLA